MTKLSTVLDQVETGSMLLPEFQRGYVWNRDQVRGLMRSIYREYPVGTLLVWETEAVPQGTRGQAPPNTPGGAKHLLLDGQQRVTTLYGVMRGQAPAFFEGDPAAFTGLHFNVEDESFGFYTPTTMRNEPRWVDVTRLFREGTKPFLKLLMEASGDFEVVSEYASRLEKLRNVASRDFHVETISGEDKTIDVVVDIFNRVNSGGTKLSKGDLALARICAEWDQARPQMRANLERWESQGYSFSLDWILRNINAVATGRAPFSSLEDVSAPQFEQALYATVHHLDHLLYLAGRRLGLDHDRVLFGRFAFPVLARVLQHRPNGLFADGREADRALYWYVHAAIRGRFSGPTETVLNKDLETADRSGVDGLISSLTRWRGGSLAVEDSDFEGAGRGARLYPLLYLLSRAQGRVDLLTGEPFTTSTGTLHVQEIFPKTELAKAGYARAEINAIANFAFVTHDTGLRLGRRLPEDHLAECSPEALRAQWIPEDRSLWTVERYREFLDARRALLAAAANRFLDQLAAGSFPRGPEQEIDRLPPTPEPPGEGPREAQLRAVREEFAELGYATPAVDCEIPDPETGRVLAVAELFWADGLQAGQGSPVILELDPEEADLARLAELGCEVFTSVDALRAYVQRRGEVAAGTRTDEGTTVHAVSPAPEAAAEDQDPALVSGDFDRAVLEVIERCAADLRYNPRYFKVMITQYGALGATRRLLSAPAVSDGFVKLWENDRLDLTAEALVVQPRFADLFSEEELDIARRRLEDFGYTAASA